MTSVNKQPRNLTITSMDEEIQNWVYNFVSRPNPLLNNFPPCPFAKKAILDERVSIQKFKNWDELSHVAADWDDSLDVAIWWFYSDRPFESMLETKLQFNTVWKPHDMWLLMDHPENYELVSGVEMNFGLAGLLLLQRFSTLVNASNTLDAQGYYASWSDDDKEFVRRRNKL